MKKIVLSAVVFLAGVSISQAQIQMGEKTVRTGHPFLDQMTFVKSDLTQEQNQQPQGPKAQAAAPKAVSCKPLTGHFVLNKCEGSTKMNSQLDVMTNADSTEIAMVGKDEKGEYAGTNLAVIGGKFSTIMESDANGTLTKTQMSSTSECREGAFIQNGELKVHMTDKTTNQSGDLNATVHLGFSVKDGVGTMVVNITGDPGNQTVSCTFDRK